MTSVEDKNPSVTSRNYNSVFTSLNKKGEKPLLCHLLEKRNKR